MKKGICQACIPGDSAEDQFTLAKEAGFDGVEIGGVEDDESALSLKRLADERGLEIPSIMGGPHWSHPLSSPDPQVRQHSADSFKDTLRHARLIGASTVLLVPAVVTEEVTYEVAWQRSIGHVRELAAVAEREQVILGIENVWNKFLLSPTDFIQYLDDAASAHVQAYFDCGNIVAYGYPHHWIRSLGDRIVKIHVKGFSQYPNVGFPYSLQSDVPWTACREAWQEIGYDDYLTVEIGPDPADPAGSIRRYGQQLDQIIEGSL